MRFRKPTKLGAEVESCPRHEVRNLECTGKVCLYGVDSSFDSLDSVSFSALLTGFDEGDFDTMSTFVERIAWLESVSWGSLVAGLALRRRLRLALAVKPCLLVMIEATICDHE